jgi:hypothetical protein
MLATAWASNDIELDVRLDIYTQSFLNILDTISISQSIDCNAKQQFPIPCGDIKDDVLSLTLSFNFDFVLFEFIKTPI